MDAASVNLLNTYVLQLHKPRKRSVKATVYVAQSKLISHQPEGGIPVLWCWPNKINSFNIQNLQGKMIKFWTKIFSWKYLIFIHLHENKYCKHSVACFKQTAIFRWLFLFVEITSKTNLDWIWFFCLFVCSKMTICPKYIPT